MIKLAGLGDLAEKVSTTDLAFTRRDLLFFANMLAGEESVTLPVLEEGGEREIVLCIGW